MKWCHRVNSRSSLFIGRAPLLRRRAGRQRLGSELLDRGRDLEGKGQREAALAFYDQARSLGGPAQSDAAARANGLRRVLADEAYAQGMRARSTDLAAAIRYFALGDTQTQIGSVSPATNFDGNDAIGVGLRVGYTF